MECIERREVLQSFWNPGISIRKKNDCFTHPDGLIYLRMKSLSPV